MAIPPPPPPPIANLKLAPSGNGNKSAGGADPRSALLQSIQKGTKLKKTTTVDKSGPILAGKISNASSTTSASRAISNNTAAGTGTVAGSNAIQANNGMPKLGGIFEGMSSMPKLKPVGGRTIPSRTSPPSESPSHSASSNNAIATNNAVNSNGVSDFNAELTKHLTLKKQKQSQHTASSTVSSDSGARINRGPPPQPPQPPGKSSAEPVQPPVNSYLFKQNQHQNSGSTSPTSAQEANISVQPNKSSLFGKGAAASIDGCVASSNNHINNHSSSSTRNNTNNSSSISNNISNNISNHTTNKYVPNHGKPNCAPKPPGIQQIIAAKNNNNGNGSLSSGTPNNARTAVSRHHSMRSPRSPPISVATGPVFPTTQHFGTMRGAPPSFQSQDAINTSIRQQPSAPISRPTVAPPRPPNMKPPPPPIRSISNTNLTTLPLSMPASVTNANNFGSASNVSTLKEQFSSIKSQSGAANSANNVSSLVSSTSTLNSMSPLVNHATPNSLSPASSKERNMNGTNAPPLPPHRTCPAPPPPIRQTSMTPSSTNSTNNSGAPPVPQRGSSMRNSNPNVQQMSGAVASTKSASPSSSSNQQFTSVSSSTRTTTTAVTRIVVDLDAKFGNAFHNVTEFPPPSPFTNFQKTYPSRANIKTHSEIKKAKAPSPPVRPSETSTISDKGDKYYLQLEDDEKNCSPDSSYC